MRVGTFCTALSTGLSANADVFHRFLSAGPGVSTGYREDIEQKPRFQPVWAEYREYRDIEGGTSGGREKANPERGSLYSLYLYI